MKQRHGDVLARHWRLIFGENRMGAFASKLAPTMSLGAAKFSCQTQKPVCELAREEAHSGTKDPMSLAAD